MIVYHGSSANFGQLRVGKRLVRNSSSLTNEGMGIYFSLDKNVAKSYGKYLYTINIDASVIDYRLAVNSKLYIEAIRNYIIHKFGVDISNYIDYNAISWFVQSGVVGVQGLPVEIMLCLDSKGEFYADVNQNVIDEIFKVLMSERIIKREFAKWNTAYIFPYNIPDCGIIKDVRYAHIINKEVIKGC